MGVFFEDTSSPAVCATGQSSGRRPLDAEDDVEPTVEDPVFGGREGRVSPCYPQGRISIVASPVTTGFEEDRRLHLRNSGLQGDIPLIFRTTCPTTVLEQRSCPIRARKQPERGHKSNGHNLDNSPHPIDLESGPSPEDRVRCCIKSIKTMGSRRQNKCSPPSAVSTDPLVSEH
ncbi:hypothetical protein Bca52824_073432 [Brassica carinata]|uniref:Uncharacterized protein n=1 Tax=Brassica carinata TaxID=52824 RepID=A0A8X7QB40_BRACI|nr:hypothetical protein Bca52824_073432 [Brassica carinata]